MNTELKINNSNLSPEALWLREEFNRRAQKNANYSIRSFARYLAIDSSSLSQMLSGQRKITKHILGKLTQRLGSLPNIPEIATSHSSALLDTKAILVSQNWEHFAILELTKTKDFKPEVKWIANRLGLSVPRTRLAVESLLDVGLLKVSDKCLEKSTAHITNVDPGKTSAARKELQRQLLTRALNAIDNTPQEHRDITSITFPMNADRIPEVRKLIADFRRALAKTMSTGETNEVFNLTIQFVPATEIKTKKEE